MNVNTTVAYMKVPGK